MRRTLIAAAVLLSLPAVAVAQGTTAGKPPESAIPAAPQAPGPEKPKLALTLSGFMDFNAYLQRNFFLGKGASGALSDKDDYGIQRFRLTPELSYGPNLKAVLRMDIAEGIWGVDGQYRDNFRPGFSNLYNNKDTFFNVHVDWAYLEATVKQLGNATFRVGRYKNQLGNLLVLDQSGNGLMVTKGFGKWKVSLDFTKMYEGTDGLTDDVFTGSTGQVTLDGRDANLFYLDASGPAGAFTVNPFIAHYQDSGYTDGITYLPNEIQYFEARFHPNVTSATAFGVAFSGKVGKVALKGEVDYLTGKDKVANANSGARELLDVNNGDLDGYNVYLDAKVPLGSLTLGGTFGLGSGDKDPMSGKGNLNRIRTLGYFYVTEVWEDSIMPDEEGITPQGLGSPASRGYRELENTTLLQLSAEYKVSKEVKLFGSATLLRATQALRPWADANANGFIDPGELGTASSKDLGTELDLKLDWNVMDNLLWTLRGGMLFPGDASGYLINGTNRYKDDAWELRTTLTFTFGGLKIM